MKYAVISVGGTHVGLKMFLMLLVTGGSNGEEKMKRLVLRGFSLDIADVRILGFYSQVHSPKVRGTRMWLSPPQSWLDSKRPDRVLGIKLRSTLAGQVPCLLDYGSSSLLFMNTKPRPEIKGT